MSYSTIGRCEECRKPDRYLEQMDYLESKNGYISIEVCAYGCDDESSEAKPVAEVLQTLLDAEIKKIKQDVRKRKSTTNKLQREEDVEQMHQQIRIYKDILVFCKMDRLNVDDWSRIISLSNHWVNHITQDISRCKGMRQTAKCIEDVKQLEEDKRIFYELHRYAKGQCM